MFSPLGEPRYAYSHPSRNCYSAVTVIIQKKIIIWKVCFLYFMGEMAVISRMKRRKKAGRTVWRGVLLPVGSCRAENGTGISAARLPPLLMGTTERDGGDCRRQNPPHFVNSGFKM
jgi:hypothetical protein